MADDLQSQIDKAKATKRRTAAESKATKDALNKFKADAEAARQHAEAVMGDTRFFHDTVASLNEEIRQRTLQAQTALNARDFGIAQEAHDAIAKANERIAQLTDQHNKLTAGTVDFGFSDDNMRAGRKNPYLDAGQGGGGAGFTGSGASGSYTPAPTPPPPAPPDTHATVRDLQTKLNGLGASLKVDGVMGPKTQAAMSRYGLDVNGNATGAGGTGGGGAPAAPAAPAGPTPGSDADVRSRYGFMAWALDDPEVGKVLRDAAKVGDDPAGLFARLSQTNWWKTNSPSMRSWQQLQATDPAAAQQQVDAQKATISQQAAKLGVNIADDRLTAMATDSVRLGWNPQQLQSAIGNEFHYVPGGQTGGALTVENQLKQMASDYLQPVADSTLSRWESDVISGKTTVQDFEGQMKAQAKSLYPTMAAAIDSGTTARQFAEPYRQHAAQLLETDPGTIDFMDPRWNKALAGIPDPKTGAKVAMSLSDWDTELRTNPVYRYQYTQGAKVEAYDMAGTMARAFGKAS